MALVVRPGAGLLDARMTMHMWVASTTTATPLGFTLTPSTASGNLGGESVPALADAERTFRRSGDFGEANHPYRRECRRHGRDPEIGRMWCSQELNRSMSRTQHHFVGVFVKTAPLSSSSRELVIAGGEKLQGFDDPLRRYTNGALRGLGVFAQAQQTVCERPAPSPGGDRGLGLGFRERLVPRNSSRDNG